MSNFESRKHRRELATSLRFGYRLRAPKMIGPFGYSLPTNFDYLDPSYLAIPCFEPHDNDNSWDSWTTSRRVSLKERFMIITCEVLTLILSYMEMPCLIISCFWHVLSSPASSSCQCAICEVRFVSGPRRFMERLRIALPIICFAPLHLPERLCRFLFPPCNHNRCKLRNYISPPPSWYEPLTKICEPIKHRLGFSEPAPPEGPHFPFLNLPLEIRNQVYLYACHAHTKHTIEWGTGKHTQPFCSHRGATTLEAEYDADVNSRQATRTEDDTSYLLDDSGIIATHGPTLPINLLLISKRVYEEVQNVFWSTTEFEVQPLTPSDASRREHGLLEESPYAKDIRRVRVRIDVARMSVGTEVSYYGGRRVDACAFEEMELKTCVGRLTTAAEGVCEMLNSSLPMLRVVEIDWIDDFGEEVSGDDLQSRANVLVPFTSLYRARVRLRRLQMPASGREEVMAMLKRIIGYI